jgi:UDP-glucose 4-epimerase
MSELPLILVTGATGKVGRHFIDCLLADPSRQDWRVRALCHHRVLPASDRVEVIKGSISDRVVVENAVAGVSHVVHLATCKETPADVMDVTVKGLFWLLEACRESKSFRRFILISGDATVGHCIYPHALPVTETQAWSAYPGCYALSKVLEECMLGQYYIQYDLDGCCLRAPWIMEKDDFRFTLSFGEDVFGGPRWRDLVGAQHADDYVKSGTIPVMLDAAGKPVLRNFVHVDDFASAILLALEHPAARQQCFNISMNEPVDYGRVAEHLKRTRNLPSVGIPTQFHSTWLDNTKAKSALGWRPQIDTERLIESAWEFQRSREDPRKIWYPG